MRYATFSAALAFVAAAAHAQPTDVPKHSCGAIPKMPGKTLMADKMVRRTFDNDVKTYGDCMKEYIDKRNAASKANLQAANDAIDEYNQSIKALNQAQDEMRTGKKDEASGGTKKY